ncbi:NUDIX hydrolase [Paenibacillus sp. N1-5-1-14]|uniref:NUDIX hydrolase n=1 Tax=Paenibacillus radicibacter TaxID=2972488 RepID=UPI002159A9DC|nr:NUDIX hydrolase [Paenibacillus radicibacter]MCR8644444.1 NUDIX hydrolase [Paenibacillus radicibacter]
MGYVEDLRAIVGHRPVILVGSVVIVVDEAGKILLQQRTVPHGSWGLPGGLMELGESVEDTARRELYEETNLQAGKLELVHIHSGASSFVKVPNGDEFFVVAVAFYTTDVHGELKVDHSEALDMKYYEPSELTSLKMVGSHREMIRVFMEKHYDNLIKE